MGWLPGSDDWHAFIEAPSGPDTERLIEHLGLEWYDLDFEPHQELLVSRLDHPGVFGYQVTTPTGPMDHVVYEPHLRYPRGIQRSYAAYGPVPVYVVVDVHQPPHASPPMPPAQIDFNSITNETLGLIHRSIY
jgi:hypothetical protein